jgi:hypothetical protein
MPEPRESFADDGQLVRYLLGLLPDEEAERLDEQSIVDDEVAARLRVVEDDLVDAYVSGTLGGETLERFESVYLASPRRRERVAFAKRLLAAVSRGPESGAEQIVGATPPPEQHERAVRRGWFTWSLAAALLVSCGALVLQDVQLRRVLTEARREGAAADQRLRALSDQLAEQRAVNTTMTQQRAHVRAVEPVAAIALVLPPQTRGVGPVSLIAVRPGAEVVPLDLQIEAGDFARYEVSLTDPATNRILWRSPVLTPTSRRQPVVSVFVPASLLKPQHYSLDLSGRHAAGASAIVGSYVFQVVPQ